MTDTAKPTEERLLVCVNPRSSSAGLIHATRRMATGLGARWFAAYVEQPQTAMLPESARSRAADHLRLAADLGGEPVTLTGGDVAEEIVRFAQQQRITRIIVGKPGRSRGIFARNPVDQLVRSSGDVDVYVIAGEPGGRGEASYVIRPERIRLADYGGGVMYLVLATLVCFAMYPYFDLSNLIMVYLLGVVLTATGCGRGPAVLSSLLSVLAFDFFFVPPRFSFTVEEAQYIVTFVVMCLVGLVISHLGAGMRQQATLARLQERQAAAMHGLSRQLASTRGVEDILQVAVRCIAEIFDGEVVAMLPNEEGRLRVAAGDVSSVIREDVVSQMHVARSALESGRMAGWGTSNSPASGVLYVPLQTIHATPGVLALRPRDPARFLLHEQVALLESLAKQTALALEVELMTSHQPSPRGQTA